MGLRNRAVFLDEECFFVTTTCHEWLPIFTAPAYFRILIDSLIFVAKKYEADYLGYVLMPNHLHLLIYFKNKNQLSSLMRDFKKFTPFFVEWHRGLLCGVFRRETPYFK